MAVTRSYLNWNLLRYGISVERIRRDRILHEALTGRPDPLHLSLMFGISDRPARPVRAHRPRPPGRATRPGGRRPHDDPGERE